MEGLGLGFTKLISVMVGRELACLDISSKKVKSIFYVQKLILLLISCLLTQSRLSNLVSSYVSIDFYEIRTPKPENAQAMH